MRSQLEEGLGGQDLTSRKDEINGIIKAVMDEMDDDEEDEEEEDDGSDFEPGSDEDKKKKKVTFSVKAYPLDDSSQQVTTEENLLYCSPLLRPRRLVAHLLQRTGRRLTISMTKKMKRTGAMMMTAQTLIPGRKRTKRKRR